MNENDLMTLTDVMFKIKSSKEFIHYVAFTLNINRIKYLKEHSFRPHYYYHVDDFKLIQNEILTNSEQLRQGYRLCKKVEPMDVTEEDDDLFYSNYDLNSYKIEFYKALESTKIADDVFIVTTKQFNDSNPNTIKMNKETLIQTIKNIKHD